MHTPVLLKTAISALAIKPNGKYIDTTAGEGGHLIEILRQGGQVLGIDRDIGQVESLKMKFILRQAQAFGSEAQARRDNLILKVGNFADIEKIAKEINFFPVDGILFDLGLSYRQISQGGKGLSYKQISEPLDMRLNVDSNTKASDLLNNLPEDKLYEILAGYSEEINSKTIAKAIIASRRQKRISQVTDLLDIIDRAIGRKDNKVYARIFQAIRIAVNDEFENLKQGLGGAKAILKKDGRIVIITFNSLEDRIVKNFVKNNNLQFVNKKPVFGDKDLLFERSAKLRIIT